jgi:hypothetical protein
VENCEIEWALVDVETGSEEALTSTQSGYVQLQADGSINVEIEDD